MARMDAGIELFGRRDELAALTAVLDRAAAGRPSGVMLSGDAGVGKSRLLGEVVERGIAAGSTVLVGRCLDAAESALPYLPFTEIVGGLAGSHPELVDAHPALSHLLPGQPPQPARAVEDRLLGQVRVFDGVLSVLDDLAAAAPVLVVVEDMHWADRSSRDLLVFLMSRLSTQRLVVLASYRTDDLHRRHPLRPVLAQLARLPAVERIELGPLDPTSTLDLVRRLADGKLSEQSVHRVARRSEGNAFFAEELVAGGPDGLPHELAELLVARVEGLAPNTQRVLRVASVAGRRVRHDQLAAVSGLGTDELEQALRDAVADHVLVVGHSSAAVADAYAFRHALLREAVYHELLPGERSRIHADYAALLAGPEVAGPAPTGPEVALPAPTEPVPARAAAPVEPGRAAELAHHALAGHNLPLALAASVHAMNEASEREAPAELLLHAERALELWNAVPDAGTVAGTDEGTVTRTAAWAASATGDPDRGIALGRRALTLAEQRGDARLRSQILRRYAMLLLDLGGREREALDSARRALELLADEPPSTDLAWALSSLARALCRLDRFSEATEAATTAGVVAASRPADDMAAAGAAADALVSTAVCEEHDGHPAGARQRLAETIALARRSGHLGVELRAHFAIGMSLLDEGRLRAAGDRFSVGMERAEATGTTWSGFGLDLRVALVVARFLSGHWAAAEAAAELAAETVSATVATRLAAAGMLVAVARGRFEVAERRLAELRDTGPRDDQVIMLSAQAGTEAALWQGRPDEAARLVQEALTGLNDGSSMGPHLGGIMLAALGVAAYADLANTGRVPVETAATAARALLATAERAAVDGLPRAGDLGPEGRAWLCRARAELTRIEGPAPAAWSAVIDAFDHEISDAVPDRLFDRMAEHERTEPAGQRSEHRSAPLSEQQCGYRQAHARLRRAEARLVAPGTDLPADVPPRTTHRLIEDDLRTALAAAERLGAAPLAGAVRALATRAGVGFGGTERSSAPAVLTPREHSVLSLVAGGRTNRQVGSELFISEKTVSVHLSRVMAKLGAASRTEAVSIAHTRGLLATHADTTADAMGGEPTPAVR